MLPLLLILIDKQLGFELTAAYILYLDIDERISIYFGLTTLTDHIDTELLPIYLVFSSYHFQMRPHQKLLWYNSFIKTNRV